MITKLYKLTDKNGQTKGGMQWGEGVTHKTKLDRCYSLCTEDVIHAYRHPLIAVFCNPIHANIDLSTGKLWECRTQCKHIADDKLKVGVKSLTTLKEIPIPTITTEQRVEIAIRIALKEYNDPMFITWANNWLTGEDRTAWTARAARAAAEAAAWAAAEAAAWAAAEAATEAAEWAVAWAADTAIDFDILPILIEVCDNA